MNLPSNVTNMHHDNSIGRYITNLSETLYLDSSWKVGLTEIHYTNSWFNLKKFNHIGLALYGSDGSDSDEEPVLSNISFLPPGRYSDLRELFSQIHEHVRQKDQILNLPILNHNQFSRRITIKLGKTKSNLVVYNFGPELEAMLGLEGGFVSSQAEVSKLDSNVQIESFDVIRGYLDAGDSVLEARHPYDLTGGIHSLLVYTNVVDYSMVGNIKAQLLRVVKIPPGSKFGDPVDITFEKPYYMPLATKEISSIEIDIKDDTGEPIDFQFGRVEVTLHFLKDG